MPSISSTEIPVSESKVPEGAITTPPSKKAALASVAALAIQAMQRCSKILVQHEDDLKTALIRTADEIVTTIRDMPQLEQDQVWMRAISDSLIPDRRETRSGVAALVAIAFGRAGYSSSAMSQIRAVIAHAIEDEVTVASLAGKGSIWAAYKALRAPDMGRLPSPPLCHLRLDSKEAARAASEGIMFRLEGGPEQGYRLVACGSALEPPAAGPVIDGDAEEVAADVEATPAEPAEEQPWFCTAPFTVSGVSAKADERKLLEGSATSEKAVDPNTSKPVLVWTLERDTPEVRAVIAVHDPQPWPRPEVA
ncbi:hypothetical protein [Roseomonas chloroacetimidivorans]|uniref:hypothetical protein n=1 Tax=Roseomonas chloroacetimidivorans TaxID=1766656 RepID=UPI003C726324